MKLTLQSLLHGTDRGWKSMYSPCSLSSCRNTLFMRSVQTRVGIGVGQQWYCSADCFASAARIKFAGLVGTSTLEAPHIPRRSIGLVMLSKGFVTDGQLRRAMAESQTRGEEMETTLVRMGFAGERQLAVARAAQWGYPLLGPDRIGQPVETDIPATLLKACDAVPVHYALVAKRLVLGFVRRVDPSLLQAVEAITGYRAEPCFITASELEEQRQQLTAAANCEEVVFEDLKTPAEMGKMAAGFAVEIGAREAHFAQCREYAWARLSGKRRNIDLLFRFRNVLEAESEGLLRFSRKAAGF
jgi:hypothetical protein